MLQIVLLLPCVSILDNINDKNVLLGSRIERFVDKFWTIIADSMEF
jgi:hypothetical protein